MLELESVSNDPMAMTLVAIDQDPEAETFSMEVPKEMGGIRVMKVRLDIIVDVGPDGVQHAGRINYAAGAI